MLGHMYIQVSTEETDPVTSQCTKHTYNYNHWICLHGCTMISKRFERITKATTKLGKRGLQYFQLIP